MKSEDRVVAVDALYHPSHKHFVVALGIYNPIDCAALALWPINTHNARALAFHRPKSMTPSRLRRRQQRVHTYISVPPRYTNPSKGVVLRLGGHAKGPKPQITLMCTAERYAELRQALRNALSEFEQNHVLLWGDAQIARMASLMPATVCARASTRSATCAHRHPSEVDLMGPATTAHGTLQRVSSRHRCALWTQVWPEVPLWVTHIVNHWAKFHDPPLPADHGVLVLHPTSILFVSRVTDTLLRAAPVDPSSWLMTRRPRWINPKGDSSQCMMHSHRGMACNPLWAMIGLCMSFACVLLVWIIINIA